MGFVEMSPFVLGQIVRRLRARRQECHFWAVHAGAELDLLVVSGDHRLGFEMKRTDSPRMTASMHVAFEALRLDRLDLIHAGHRSFELAKGVRAVAPRDLSSAIEPIRGDDRPRLRRTR